MRVLLDEYLQHRLKAELPDHEVRTTQDVGILAMLAPSNRLVDLRPPMTQVRKAWSKVRAGQVSRVGG